ncbi:aldehyde dehydrogenase family protein [Yinghuangia seranimata]|uniref:aldehyde dehydrogenase family protein n=1 Tax=Yinghuangia seranimata TaxID=408067 RepID=UPI00248D06FF|nr:aldehyde dehydrogenase family protein [Yinghuangia seranimata]MDI2132052.1 aldehyde dehydrogenase family protein [Yinghuangia seranimata]
MTTTDTTRAQSADETLVSRNPAAPDDVVATIRSATPDEVAGAAARARGAHRAWVGLGAAARAAALHGAAQRVEDAADDLAALVVREVGKPVAEARGEVARTVAILRYYAQQAFDPVGAVHEPAAGAGLLLTRRRPHGVAGLITPWNFPLAIPVWKAAPALAAGNAVLLKPSPDAAACALRLAALLDDVLPPGLFTVLPGGAATGSAVVEAADVVSFTGSTAIGTEVVRAATARGIPVQAEMGGHNAAIVLPDADPKATAAQLAAAAFGFAGQKCTATKRVIVVGDPAPLRDALVEATAALALGDPGDGATVVGPVIGERARDAVLAASASAVEAGGTLLAGGQEPSGTGWFVAPQLLEGVPEDHWLAREEVFGPIAVLFSVPDLDAAVALASSVRHGLVTSVHTRDLDAALEVVDRVDTGLVKVNAPSTGVDFHMPFGGEKESSRGPREQGKAALDFYSHDCTVSLLPSGWAR